MKKRLLSLPLLLGLLCAARTALPLQNPGFEDGLRGWTPDEQGMTLFLSEAAHTGSMGVRIRDLSLKAGNELLSEQLPATPGRIYEISFMARAGQLNGNDGVGVYLVCYGKNGKPITQYRGQLGEICQFLMPTPEWGRLTLCGRAPEGTASVAVRFHTRSDSRALLDLDDVQLHEITEDEAKAAKAVVLEAKRHQRRDQLKMNVPLEEVAKTMRTIAVSNHPRLFASAPQFEALAHRVREANGIHHRMAERLAFLADSLLDTPPLQRVMEGRRLLGVSRNALYRISTLALCYRLYGKDAYRDRCLAEMRAIASFTDWNPSHFLDVAEMTLALATGYDWLHDSLSDDDRRLCADAILSKGLKAGSPRDWWRTAENNWGQVCHAGMIAAALAVAEADLDLTTRAIHESIQNLAIPMRVYAPNGNYPEGPGYWEYGTGFNVLALAMLNQAFGTDFGLSDLPGFRQTATYFDFVTAPSGKTFTYSDCGTGPRSRMGIPWWFAYQFDQPAIVERHERAILERRCADRRPVRPERDNGWFHAFTFLWLDDPQSVELPKLPLLWNAQGPVPIVIMRTSWDDDHATFVGLKAGSPSANHGHMDGGSFIVESNRIRWFADLGAEPYHRIESMNINLWDGRQTGERWKLFRLNNFGHNTLVIDNHLQLVRGHVDVLSVSETPERRTAVLDLTPVYADVCSKAIRTVILHADGHLDIIDELAGLTPGAQVVWGANTFEQATLNPADNTITLTRGHAGLLVANTSQTGEWRLTDASQPPFRGDSPNRNLKRVELVASAPQDGTLRLAVSMTPTTRHDD